VIYCFDTSAFIQGWNDLYPPDTFPDLWERIVALIEEQRIVAPDEVFRELGRKDDQLKAWAKVHRQVFVEWNGAFLVRSKEITNRYRRMLDQKPGKNGADPLVVALAIDRGAAVVTEELGTGNMNSPGIPDVCRAERVQCINVLSFIKNEGWRW
jgi:uncharacterized protein DUF4411